MKLQAREATVSDLQRATSYYGPETGDFCTPYIKWMWPETEDNAQLRAEMSIKQQIDSLQHDPTVRMAVVVNNDSDDDLVAIARWQWYPNGIVSGGGAPNFAGLKMTDDPSMFPSGFRKDLYFGLLGEVFVARKTWMRPTEGPFWVLTTLVTRRPLRKHGAASLLLKWGLDQAARDGTPAYLEALPEAVHLYESHGFREVDRHTMDCAKWGVPGLELVNVRMRADPKT